MDQIHHLDPTVQLTNRIPHVQPTDPTRARPPCPRHPSDPAHPNTVPPDLALPNITPLPPPPHASPVGEHRFLLRLAPPHHWRVPLPPPPVASPASAPASSAPRLPAGERRVLLHPAPLPSVPMPPPPLCLIK
jgi:hypothetical protein